MKNTIFNLTSEYIALNKLLKLMNICQSGGEAKALIEDNKLKVNGELETRKRRKLRPGDSVIFEDIQIILQ